MGGRRTAAAVAGGAAVAAVGVWVLVGTPGLGGAPAHDVLTESVASSPSATAEPSPSTTPSPKPSPTPSPTASPAPSPTPSPTATPAATRSPKPSPTPSPTDATSADVGSGAYASVLLRRGYGYCPCDPWNMRQPAPNPALSLSCADPGTLSPGKLFTLSVTVRNSSAAPVTFTELAGPRFVYLSLANDPNRTKDMNGGFADNAGHTTSSNGWWVDPSSNNGANVSGAGTVKHVVPAHGSLTLAMLGSTVRTSDATPLIAGPYSLEAGFVLDTHGTAWTCAARSVTVG